MSTIAAGVLRIPLSEKRLGALRTILVRTPAGGGIADGVNRPLVSTWSPELSDDEVRNEEDGHIVNMGHCSEIVNHNRSPRASADNLYKAPRLYMRVDAIGAELSQSSEG